MGKERNIRRDENKGMERIVIWERYITERNIKGNKKGKEIGTKEGKADVGGEIENKRSKR